MESATARKPGIWTQHIDPNSGRAYYFNLALGRSYWELPEDLKAQVQQPLVEELRRWDPKAVEDKYGAGATRHEDLKRRREEAIAAAKARSDQQELSASVDSSLTLQERMALAAQRKKEESEASRQTGASRQVEDSAESSEYLAMVRQLQHVDRETETSGGKWLVR